VEAIAEAAGVDRKTVRNWAMAAGLPPRPPARERFYSAGSEALAVRLYLQTAPVLTMSAIMAKTGMSDSTVRASVVAAGHPLRTKGRQRKHDHDLVVRLDAEHGPSKAAKILGCSPGTVHYHRDVERRLKARASLRSLRKGKTR
jgi:hypothetical protein